MCWGNTLGPRRRTLPLALACERECPAGRRAVLRRRDRFGSGKGLGPRPPLWLVRVSVVRCVCVCARASPLDDERPGVWAFGSVPVSRRVRRRAGAARSRGDSPVRREVIWPTILPYMFGLFESSQDVPGEAGRPSGREFQSPGVGSRPGGRHARPAEGGYWGVTPLENSSRSAGGSECMQEMAPRCGIIKGTDSPLIPSSFRRFEGVGRRRLTR